MSVAALLEQLRRLDIRVWDAGQRLRVSAPAGALTPELQEQLVAQRSEILALLQQQTDAAQEPMLRRVDRRASLPLSFAQERMWVLHHIEPASAAYHIVYADRLRGELNARALQDAWRTVVQRHELLRARVPSSDGTPEVVIDQPFERLWSFVDLSIKGIDTETALLELIDDQVHEPFDLQTGPLSRVTLARLGTNEHALILRLHHIVADQWSVALIRRELGAVYDASGNPTRANLPPLDVHYVDYAAWQRESLRGAKWDRLLAHWRRRLQGAEPIELPTLQPRLRRMTFDGQQVSVPLPPALLEHVGAVARQSGATLFMALMAVFAALLYRYTGRDDLSIGTPVAGRNRVELERLVGVFINTLVLRMAVKPEQGFATLLNQVQQVTLDAQAHHEAPFERLVAALTTSRAEAQMPLVQVMFNLLNTPPTTLQLDGVDVESIDVSKRGSALDLTLTVDAHGRTLTAEFRRDVLSSEGALQLLAHYVRMLEAVVADPQLPIVNVPFLSSPEADWLDVTNGTERSFDLHTGIETLIARQAAASPAAVAITCGDESLTYGELDDRSSRLATTLRQLGVGPDVLVGICLERTHHVPVALLAVLKAGGAYVPLDADLPPARMSRIVRDSQLRLCLVDRHTASTIETTRELRPIRVENPDHEAGASHASPIVATSEHLAYVLYTSGSTGEPKGVQVSRRALTNLMLAMQEQPGITSDAVMVATTTLSFDIAALELLLPLTVGARVAVARRDEATDGRALLALLQKTQATMLQATPTTWRMLIEAGWDGNPEITVLCGGEALSTDLARQLTARARHVWNLYGPTETTIWSTVERVTPDTDVIGIGSPIANTTAYVLDAALQRTPVGVPGELYIGGAGLARGYLGDAELTAARFVAHPFCRRPNARLYRTGDLVRVRPDRRLEYLSRLDTQVKLRGYRIELSEIELALAEHPGVAQAVAAIRDDGGNPTLVAYLTRCKGARLQNDDLRSFLRERLPVYMVPTFFTVVDSLPMTSNGKLDRKALPAPTPIVGREPDTTPPTATEIALAEIWSLILKVPKINRGHDFFSLGGHSLLAMRLVAQVQKKFGVALPPGTLFEKPTLGELADRIDEMRQVPQIGRRPQHALVKIAAGGSSTPITWVHGIGGEVFTYMAISRYLGTTRPVYGIAADWSAGPQGQPLAVETMAERYVAELRAVQPVGPYHLGGFCAAALIALEMAHQLERAGQQVGAVIALDHRMSPLDAFPTGTARWLAGLHNARKWFLQDAVKSPPGDLVGRLASRMRRIRSRVHLWTIGGQPDIRDTLGMWRFSEHQAPMLRLHHDVIRTYTPRPFHGRVALFVPDAMPLMGPWPQADRHGWDDLAEGGVSVHVVKGSHATMLIEPYAKELAAAIDQVLARADQQRHVFTRSA